MSKPVLAVGLLATMVGAWYWAMQPATQLVVSRRAAPVAAARPARDVPAVHLADLDADAASRPTPDDGRNPFANSQSVWREGSGGADRRATSPAPPSVSPGPPVPVWPRLELIGVAEGRVGGRVARTGILSTPRGVQHVQAGDVVAGVYRVERIDTDGIDVRLLPEERVLRLTLRP